MRMSIEKRWIKKLLKKHICSYWYSRSYNCFNKYYPNKQLKNIEWIIENKNWIFSGIGVFIFCLVINWFLKGKANSQIQGGINSKNIQSGRNTNFK